MLKVGTGLSGVCGLKLAPVLFAERHGGGRCRVASHQARGNPRRHAEGQDEECHRAKDDKPSYGKSLLSVFTRAFWVALSFALALDPESRACASSPEAVSVPPTPFPMLPFPRRRSPPQLGSLDQEWPGANAIVDSREQGAVRSPTRPPRSRSGLPKEARTPLGSPPVYGSPDRERRRNTRPLGPERARRGSGRTASVNSR